MLQKSIHQSKNNHNIFQVRTKNFALSCLHPSQKWGDLFRFRFQQRNKKKHKTNLMFSFLAKFMAFLLYFKKSMYFQQFPQMFCRKYTENSKENSQCYRKNRGNSRNSKKETSNGFGLLNSLSFLNFSESTEFH